MNTIYLEISWPMFCDCGATFCFGNLRKVFVATICRTFYYGSPKPKLPSWSMDDPIPNIGHMVLLGGSELNLLTYLSIRSMIHCVGADAMYIYIDKEPTGTSQLYDSSWRNIAKDIGQGQSRPMRNL